MSVFATPLDAITLHPSGWLDLPGGAAITRLPLWDGKDALFARIGHGPVGAWLAERGLRLPTVAEYDLLHRVALHVEPFTMPTPEQLRAAGVPDKTPAIDAFRTANMRSMAWCVQHDAEVFNRLAKAGWDGEPVANAGKHFAVGGVIVGWWRANGSRIQNPSSFHASVPTYTDYATTIHAVRPAPDEATAPTERSPALPWDTGLDLSTATLGERCLAWLGWLSQQGLRTIPGPEHDARIVALSASCRRGGRFLGVEAGGRPLWDGGSPLPLHSDEEAWCAATQSEALLQALRPGEVPPHGLRVSVRELCEDARAAGTLRGLDYAPLPGDLAILGRAGELPTKGGRGHVRRVVSAGLVPGMYVGLAGNESGRVVGAQHSLTHRDLDAWVAYPR